ncbi:MAG: efflux RND transporter periplasmic adaptor subunit [Calothrix sp. FI2-JRJ7]|jgi:HlyD family secretion protein|nr:efflux RND transporter periplasmic adaptor subunit [Calothrix sp. FI2-JRJ7]
MASTQIVKSKKRLKIGLKLLLGSGLLALLGGSGWWFYIQNSGKSSNAVALPIMTADREDIEITINESGAMQLGGQRDLKSPGEVTVDKVLVKVGDTVQAGQRLLVLRNKEQQSTVANQDLAIRKQKQTLARSQEKVTEAKDKLAVVQQELRQPIKQEFDIRKAELELTRSREKIIEARQKLATAKEEALSPAKQVFDIQKAELELTRSREKITETKEKLAVQQRELKNLEVLSQKGFIPGDELVRQQASVRDAQVTVREAEFDVRTKTIDLKRQILEAKRATEPQTKVLEAQTALKDAQSDLNSKTLEFQRLKIENKRQTELQEKLLNARAEVRNAESDVETQISELQKLALDRKNLETQVQNNFVTAPITGKILNVKAKNGDGIKSGDILITLGNPSQELVNLQIGTLDAAKVKVGQPAKIKVIGPNSQEYTGKVQEVQPQAISGEGGSGASLGGGSSTQAKVPATVLLDKPTRTLIPGSQVSVEIIVEQRKNVVAVNLEAVQRDEGEPFVWIRDKQGKAQKQKVALGLEATTKVEIKSGLKAGDKIILPGADTTLEPGKAVKEAPPDAAPQLIPDKS